MKYLDYCYLCINNRKASELSETQNVVTAFSLLLCLCQLSLNRVGLLGLIELS